MKDLDYKDLKRMLFGGKSARHEKLVAVDDGPMDTVVDETSEHSDSAKEKKPRKKRG